MEKQRALIILGASSSHIPLIEQALEKGLSPICVDRDPDAAGISYCKKHIRESTHTPEPIIERLSTMNETYSFAGVITRSHGAPTITSAKIAAHFGLKGPSIDAAVTAASKKNTISFAHANNISAPIQYGIDDIDAGRARFPMVAKPDRTSIGKWGVFLLKNQGDFEEFLNRTEEKGISFDRNSYEFEEFIPGRDILTISLIHEGVQQPWLFLDEQVGLKESGEFIGLGFSLPSKNSFDNRLNALNTKLGNCLGLHDGILISAYRIDDNRSPVLIEVHLDLGGDLVLDKLVPMLSSYNPFERILRCFLGDNPQIYPVTNGPIASVIYLYDFDPVSAKVIEKLRGIREVREIKVGKGPTDRTGHVVLLGEGADDNQIASKKITEILGREKGLGIQ